MFDGLAPPGLRTGSPSRLDLDTSDSINHSINRGLSGWWPFLDGAGTIADISGAKRNGAPYGAPTRTASRVGRLGTLSNSNGYIAPDRVGNLARYSYVFWVRGSTTPANFAGVLCRTSTPGGTTITNSIQVYTNNLRVYHDQTIDPPGDTGITVASILDGKLHCVAITYDGATVYGFRDGRFVGSASMAVQGTPRTGAGDLLIGLERNRTSGYSWANQIGNVREWDRQLTSAEIERLFVEPFAGGIAPEDRLIWSMRVPTAGGSVTGASDVTLGAITGAFTGQTTNRGASAVTLGAITGTATGSLTIQGQSAVTLGDITGAFTGASAASVGSSSVTLPPITGAFTGQTTNRGASAVTLGAITGSFTATTGSTYPWSNTTLSHTDVAFGGGSATFTDPAIGAGISFGQFGQQVTIPAGKWRMRATVTLSGGASGGFYGPPYFSIGFFRDGVGLGAYAWPSPLTGSASASAGFSGEIFFDFELVEETVTWMVAQGGNCNFVVDEFRIDPFLMNYAVWCSGDSGGFEQRYEETVWTGGTFTGPATEVYDRYVGPAIGGLLHKSFQGEGARAVFKEVHIRSFETGQTHSDQSFLARLEGSTIGYCGTCIKFTPGSTNAGENMRITNCILFNSGLGLDVLGGGEWTVEGTSIDFCRLGIIADRGARITFDKHMEANPVEARLYIAASSGTWTVGDTVYGTTSGATAEVLIVRDTDARPHLVVAVTDGTFTADEGVSNGALTTAWLDGALSGAEPWIDLAGGATLTIPHGGILLSGAEHRGAPYFIRVADNLSQVALGKHWNYNFQTASGDWATGAGRVSIGELIGASNPQFPNAIIRNINADLFGGAGRIAGPGTAADMSRYPPADAIGLHFGLYADSGTPTSRGVIPSVAAVTADTGVAHTSGAGSLKLLYDPAYSGGATLSILVPVRPGKIILDEYWISKPDAVAPVSLGPYTTGAPGAGDTITVSIAAGDEVATIEDKHVQWIGGNGPQAGWTVTLANITGNPGGIANAVWNATHTVVARTGAFTVTVDLGTAAASAASGAGGGTVQSTWSQTNFRFYERRFWVAVVGQDAYGRPIVGQDEYQGESEIQVDLAAHPWTRRNGRNWGYTDITIPGDVNQRYANGRAPDWATHFEMRFDWANVRFAAATPPPLYLADFFANAL